MFIFCMYIVNLHENFTNLKWKIDVHSTTFLIGHFYFAVFLILLKPISTKFSAFHTDVCLYRNPLKLASSLSRSVFQLYHY